MKKIEEYRNKKLHSTSMEKTFWKSNVKTQQEILATHIEFHEKDMFVYLNTNQKIIVPLKAFPRLYSATESQRRKYRFIGKDAGIHWKELDEDLSVEWLIQDYGIMK